MNKLELKSCLIGTLLGDGYIEKTSSKSARFQLIHSIKQKEYLLWKAKILEEFTSVHIDEFETKLNGKSYGKIRAKTKSIPEFLKLRNQMYFYGRKSITSHLMKILDWRGIAIWFLDDGYIDKNRAQFATYGFNEAEHYLMKEWLAKKEIHTSVAKRRQYFYLTTSAEDTEKIVEWVRKLNIPSMNYKICSYDKLSPTTVRNKQGQFIKQYKRDDDIV